LPKGDEIEMKKSLVKHGPLIISIDHLNESFMRYKSGIYYEPNCTEQNSHAVLLVGYGSENGNDYWIVKNSFGKLWGENGFFRIARNKKNHCSIATDVYFFDTENE
jgi:C1A family cysteine protease